MFSPVWCLHHTGERTLQTKQHHHPQKNIILHTKTTKSQTFHSKTNTKTTISNAKKPKINAGTTKINAGTTISNAKKPKINAETTIINAGTTIIKTRYNQNIKQNNKKLVLMQPILPLLVFLSKDYTNNRKKHLNTLFCASHDFTPKINPSQIQPNPNKICYICRQYI